MLPIILLALVSAGCLGYVLYRLALEVAFRRRAVRATGRITRLAAGQRALDDDPLISRPVEIATVAVAVAPRSTVDRTLPHALLDPGRYRVGDTVSLRLDPRGDRTPLLDGAAPGVLLRWAVGAVFFAECTAALTWLAVVLSRASAG